MLLVFLTLISFEKMCPEISRSQDTCDQYVIIPTRCNYLCLKQICLVNMIPAILIILTIHIIIAIRRMFIKILSVVINDWELIKVIVPGGCCLALRSSVTICKTYWNLSFGLLIE